MAKRSTATASFSASGGLPALDSQFVNLDEKPIRVTRTTVVLPETLDQNLELYAVRAGLPKGEIIKRVLAEFLTKQGFQPDKRPRSIEVAY